MRSREDLLRESVADHDAEEHFPGAIFVEAWCSDTDIQRKWQKFGFIAILPLSQDGIYTTSAGGSIGWFDVDRDAPYGEAITDIEVGEMSGQLPEGERARALQYMMFGTFEESDLAQFLPEL